MEENLPLNLSSDSLFYRASPISLYSLHPHCSANILIEDHPQGDGRNDQVKIFQSQIMTWQALPLITLSQADHTQTY